MSILMALIKATTDQGEPIAQKAFIDWNEEPKLEEILICGITSIFA